MSFFDKARENIGKVGESDFVTRLKQSFDYTMEKSLKLVSDESLADAIISAAKKQEKVNEILKERGSNYRISDLDVEFSVSPAIVFGIRRLLESEDTSPGSPEQMTVASPVRLEKETGEMDG
ncbi:MAG: hypothetical protein ACFCBW_20250 [Candidatus Competibacterales bacterium]